MGYNPLIYLIRKYPDKGWNFSYISENPSISLKDINDNIDLPWNFENVFNTWGSGIVGRPDLTFEFVWKHKDKWSDIAIRTISKHMNINIIESHPEFSWNYIGISLNHTLTIDFVLKHRNENWNWMAISKNRGIKLSDILNHRELPWNTQLISNNKSLTIEDVLNHPELPWMYMDVRINLCRRYKFNSIISMEYINKEELCCISTWISRYAKLDDVDNNPDFPWDYTTLSRNPLININFVLKHKDEEWDWVSLTANKGIKYKYIINNPTLPWDSDYTWSKHDLTSNDLSQFSESEIRYCALNSEVLTVEFIESHINKRLNWLNISQHEFKHDRHVYATRLEKMPWMR